MSGNRIPLKVELSLKWFCIEDDIVDELSLRDKSGFSKIIMLGVLDVVDSVVVIEEVVVWLLIEDVLL